MLEILIKLAVGKNQLEKETLSKEKVSNHKTFDIEAHCFSSGYERKERKRSRCDVHFFSRVNTLKVKNLFLLALPLATVEV